MVKIAVVEDDKDVFLEGGDKSYHGLVRGNHEVSIIMPDHILRRPPENWSNLGYKNAIIFEYDKMPKEILGFDIYFLDGLYGRWKDVANYLLDNKTPKNKILMNSGSPGIQEDAESKGFSLVRGCGVQGLEAAIAKVLKTKNT